MQQIEITRNEANVSRINDRDERDKTHFYLLFIMTVMKVVTAKITVITFICFRNCTPLLFILCQSLCFISRSNRMLYKTTRNGIKSIAEGTKRINVIAVVCSQLNNRSC